MSAKQIRVKVYSTPECPYCNQTKEFLKAHKVAYQDIDVSKDQEAANEMIEKSGQMGVPVIVVDDQVVIVGFDRKALKNALALKKKNTNRETVVAVNNSSRATKKTATEEDWNNLWMGAFWFFGGALVTIGTYFSPSEGGTFWVAWGAIIFGALQFISGFANTYSELKLGVMLPVVILFGGCIITLFLIATDGFQITQSRIINDVEERCHSDCIRDTGPDKIVKVASKSDTEYVCTCSDFEGNDVLEIEYEVS